MSKLECHFVLIHFLVFKIFWNIICAEERESLLEEVDAIHNRTQSDESSKKSGESSDDDDDEEEPLECMIKVIHILNFYMKYVFINVNACFCFYLFFSFNNFVKANLILLTYCHLIFRVKVPLWVLSIE